MNIILFQFSNDTCNKYKLDKEQNGKMCSKTVVV